MRKEVQDLQSFLTQKSFTIEPNVLDAGCGSRRFLKFPQETIFTGIDISQRQLEKYDDLNIKILGDISTYPLENNKYDLIISWDVLEHLAAPIKALNNLIGSLKWKGYLILAMPNVFSLKGIVTKYTPHWFHVFVYRKIYGQKNAGLNDTAPFKTYLKNSISKSSIKKITMRNNLDLVFFRQYDSKSKQFKKKSKFLFLIYVTSCLFLKVISFNKLGGFGNSDLIYVLQKN